MKTFLAYTPIVLSYLLLGAHFLRYQNWLGVAAALVLIGLLLVRRPWVARLAQLALVLSAAEWVWTTLQLVDLRAAHGQPYTRMAIILSVVALWTLLSALLFQLPALKRVYRLDAPSV